MYKVSILLNTARCLLNINKIILIRGKRLKRLTLKSKIKQFIN